MGGSSITQLLTIGGLAALAMTLFSGCSVKKPEVNPLTAMLAEHAGSCDPDLSTDQNRQFYAKYLGSGETFVNNDIFNAYLTITGEIDDQRQYQNGIYIDKSRANKLSQKQKTQFRNWLIHECGCEEYTKKADVFVEMFTTQGNIILADPASYSTREGSFDNTLRFYRFWREYDNLQGSDIVRFIDTYSTHLDSKYGEALAQEVQVPSVADSFDDPKKASFGDLGLFEATYYLQSVVAPVIAEYVASPDFDPNKPLFRGILEDMETHDRDSYGVFTGILDRIEARPGIDNILP